MANEQIGFTNAFNFEKVAEEADTRNSSSLKVNTKGLSWLGMIAAVLGRIQGETAARMLDLVDQLQKNADKMPDASDTSPAAGNLRQDLAAEANVLNARLQGESQMYKIQSESTSTVVKGIGEGLSRVASKS